MDFQNACVLGGSGGGGGGGGAGGTSFLWVYKLCCVTTRAPQARNPAENPVEH